MSKYYAKFLLFVFLIFIVSISAVSASDDVLQLENTASISNHESDDVSNPIIADSPGGSEKISPNLVIDVNDTTVCVDVGEGATGDVALYINSEEFFVPVDGGKAVLEDVSFKVGNNSIVSYYPGDELFNANITSIVHNVPKFASFVIVSAKNITYGKNASIAVEVGENQTGFAGISVNGSEYLSKIESGKAAFDVSGLGAGNYEVTAVYSGDDTYEQESNLTSFKVNKAALNAEVRALNVTTLQNATFIISVPHDFRGKVRISVDGESFNGNASSLIQLSNLTAGDKSAKVKFYGDDNYKNRTYTVNFTVSNAKNESGIKVEVKNTDIIASVENNAFGNVTFYVNGKEYQREISDGVASLEGVLSVGDNSIVAYYPENELFSSSVSSLSYNMPKLASSVKVSGKTVIYGNDASVTVTVPKSQSGFVTISVNSKSYTNEVKSGKAVFEIPALDVGTYKVTATYNGDDTYAKSTNSSSFRVTKATLDASVEALDITTEENASFVISVPDDFKGNVRINVDGISYDGDISTLIQLPSLKAGDKSATVKFYGDDNYKDKTLSVPFKVSEAVVPPVIKNKTDPSMSLKVDDNKVTVTLPGDATGNVTVCVNGKKTVLSLNSGNVVLSNVKFVEGNNAITAVYSGDDAYNAAAAQANKEVPIVPPEKLNPSVTINVKNSKITVNLPEDATGDVNIIVNNRTSRVSINNGKAVISDAKFIEGNNVIVALYSGDDTYYSGFNSTQVIIKNDNPVIVSTRDVVKYFSGSERFIVNVVYKNGTPVEGAEVKYTINSVTYSKKTNENGVASFPLNLNSGNYSAGVEVKAYGHKSMNSIVILPTISAKDVTKVFRNATQYYATFFDSKGNPLSGTRVSFNINGVFYNRTTDADGKAMLKLNLEKGKYVLTALNPVTGEMKTNTVTIISQLETRDLTKYYKNSTQFVVRVVNSNGKYAGAGEKVKFNIHGMVYERTTNSTGHAKLNINLEPGTYSITTYYKECREGNTITVLSTLSAKDLTMKYNDGSKFKAHVLSGKGKPYQDQKVSFNLNGVVYNRYTDSNGDAKLNINLQPGKYIVTSEYNGYKISNTINIKA